MNVVRHVAVRENCEAQIGCGALDLRTHDHYVLRLYEDLMSLVRAEREEILMKAHVVEGFQVFGSMRDHAAERCKIGSRSG
jgi:hypothetical protein